MTADALVGWCADGNTIQLKDGTLISPYSYRSPDGGIHADLLWYDDPQTLAAKYAAIKAAGVRGVGMWTADCAGNDASVAAGLWGAVPSPAGGV